MGNYMATAMDENLKKNQAFMAEMQAVTVQRQIQVWLIMEWNLNHDMYRFYRKRAL